MRALYQLFADILTYPKHDIIPLAKQCAENAGQINEEAAFLLKEFSILLDQVPMTRVQEIYTSTFDLQVVCYPYVGYQLFGESYQRGAFMAKLNEYYRLQGFAVENELPDHLAVMLRFLSGSKDAELNDILIQDGLLPSLQKMASSFGDSDNPYKRIIDALFRLLKATRLEPTQAPVNQ